MYDVNGVSDNASSTGFVEFTFIATVVSMAAALIFKHDAWHVTSAMHAVSSILPG